MTDKIIPREKAIDRMRDGLPCETNSGVGWILTDWSDFNEPLAQFRIPPEPRREVREWWLNAYEPHSTALTVFDSQKEADRAALKLRSEVIHVREVLPDEVCLRKMTENGVRDFVFDKNVVAARCSTGADKCVAFARAIGLIREEDKS